ncbi:MAG: hypothetical protein M0Z50_09035 [Planctomycetia bacterium]|nr:hypothetical protein [Planctomycetia bacterium]
MRITMLCEDTQHAAFARYFLELQGIHRREIRAKICPPGSQAASQWVVDTYLKELAEYRRRSNYQQLALAVMIDADNNSVAQRQAWLEQACDTAQISGRQGDEAVLYIVPQRNIETWFAYLRGDQINEHDCYPRYKFESDCRKDAGKLYQICRAGNLPPHFPESLRIACVEYQRLQNVIRRLP